MQERKGKQLAKQERSIENKKQVIHLRLLPTSNTKHSASHFFFFWWGLLHGPQQGPDRMKEKTYDWEKENSCLKQKNPP